MTRTFEGQGTRLFRGASRACAGALAIALAGTPVRLARAASPQSEVAARYTRGVELAEQGAYEQARAEFQRAYELRPHHSVLYNLGQVCVALDRPLAAVDHLKQYLRDGGAAIGSERRRAVERQLRKLEARVPRLTIDVEPAGTQVSVDGRRIGRSPLTEAVPVDVGTHRIEAAREGYAPAATAMSVSSGARERVLLQLFALPSLDAAASLGWLRLGCDGHAGDVLLDDQVVARIPGETTLTVPAGAHVVAFRRASPAAAETAPQPVTVKAKATVVATCPWPPPAPPAKPVATLDARLDRRIGDDGSDEHRYRGGAYALWAAGGGLAGAAFGLALWNKNRLDDWNAEDHRLKVDEATMPYAALAGRITANNDLHESIRSMNYVTAGLAIGAGVAAVAGTVLYFRRARVETVAITPSGVLLGASF